MTEVQLKSKIEIGGGISAVRMPANGSRFVCRQSVTSSTAHLSTIDEPPTEMQDELQQQSTGRIQLSDIYTDHQISTGRSSSSRSTGLSSNYDSSSSDEEDSEDEETASESDDDDVVYDWIGGGGEEGGADIDSPPRRRLSNPDVEQFKTKTLTTDSGLSGGGNSDDSAEDVETRLLASILQRPRRNTDAGIVGGSSGLLLSKRVSFADAKGRDLATIRTFCQSAITLCTETCAHHTRRRQASEAELELDFRQPWLCQATLKSRLDACTVALETVFAYGRGRLFGGTILVVDSTSDEKRTIFARVSLDSWKSHIDVPAVHIGVAGRGIQDAQMYGFDVQSLRERLGIDANIEDGGGLGPKIVFAVGCRVHLPGGKDWIDHWDNNDGKNYTLLVKD